MLETKVSNIKPIVYIGIINNNKLLLVDYKHTPNPTKSGCWIPAPGLEFGEDPKEIAEKVASDYGFEAVEALLFDVESFVLPGGWHLICHYTIQVKTEPKSHPNIKEYKWVTIDQLVQMSDIAHGKWEINVGKRYLNHYSNQS